MIQTVGWPGDGSQGGPGGRYRFCKNFKPLKERDMGSLVLTNILLILLVGIQGLLLIDTIMKS